MHADRTCPCTPRPSVLTTTRTRTQANYERLRGENYYREEQRWNQMQTNEQRREGHLQTKRQTGEGMKANHGSEHYNILNLNYNATPQGQVLQYKVRVSMLCGKPKMR